MDLSDPASEQELGLTVGIFCWVVVPALLDALYDIAINAELLGSFRYDWRARPVATAEGGGHFWAVPPPPAKTQCPR